MVGLLFPGQGAQTVGMGKGLYDSSSAAKEVFALADRVLGFSLSKIIFEGPEEELTKTVNSQPAIYVTSLAALAALKEKAPNFQPTAACGLSLGEFSALAALGVFSFEDGLKIVQKRGQWMEEAAASTKGSMISLVGLSLQDAEAVARDAGIEVANINSPEQIVLSGEFEGVQKSEEIAKVKGAKRAIILNVSGAFHSKLMKSAEEKLINFLKPITFNAPSAEFLSNVTGSFESNPERIKENLGKQVTSSVQWVKTLQSLNDKNYNNFIELAPSRVLKGLARRTAKELVVDTLETDSDLMRCVDTIREREEGYAPKG